MKSTKMMIQWVPGAHGGWTATCYCCASVVVRDTWDLAMAHVIRHREIHREDGPFVIVNRPPALTPADMSDVT